MSYSDLLTVPAARAESLRVIAERCSAARNVVLTTHVNADGDGTGSEVALAAWLRNRGVASTIINPTPFPTSFRFLLPDTARVADLDSAESEQALAEADLLVVLDTSEHNRIGALAGRVPADRTIVIDHHPPGPEVLGSLALQDPAAAATGELMYDLFAVTGAEWTTDAVAAMYVALVTDTGSFRYGNTSPRVHAITAELLARGVDPEAMYRRLFATVSRPRLELLGTALAGLRAEPETGLAWITVTDRMMRESGAGAEDLDGLSEHARSLVGTEVAVLFRETPEGKTKISLRSNGETDVNRVARQFGGGGHVKASGALIDGSPDQVAPDVLAAVRAAVRRDRA